MSTWRLFGTGFIWGLAINGFSRWAGDYCGWWCPWTVEGFTDLSFYSAVASLVIFWLAVLAVDGLAWLVRRWAR